MEVTTYHVPGAIARIPGPTVALTFDDGPDPRSTGRLLAILDRFNVSATFFVIGRQLERHPDLGRTLVAAGHELANHTYTHTNLARTGSAQIDRELVRCQQAIRAITGQAATMFRPPFGAVTTRVVTRARVHGLATVLWSIDTRDWARPGARAITARAVAAGPGDIILFHDLPTSIEGTAAALPAIIKSLTARGLALTTLDRSGIVSPTTW